MANATKIDWTEAQKYYLADNTVSLADVAKKYKVSKTVVEQRASKEGWAKTRQMLGDVALENYKQKLIDAKSSANDRHLSLYKKMETIAERALDTLLKGSYLTDKRGDAVLGKDGEPIEVPPDSFELHRLSNALKTAIEGERVVLGLPTSVSVHQDPEGKPLQPVFIYDLRGKNENQQQAGSDTPSGQ